MRDRLESPHEDGVPPPSIGLGRVVQAFRHSLAGLASAWRTEGAFRQEIIAAAVLFPIACLMPVTLLERVLLIGSIVFVMVVELLNSSIEATVDRISLERHPLSRHAKDVGSAAVLMAIVIPVLVWGAIAGPLLLALIRHA
jgi:diacylglycerol kinase (ATP)